jgi:hypothetical protein
MLRSGSTWQYQVAGDLLDRRGGANRLGFLFGEQIPPLAEAGEGWHLVKSHEGHPVCAEWLAKGSASCLYSYRDLRDVAFSVAAKKSESLFDTVAKNHYLRRAIYADGFWRSQANVFIQRYETWLQDPPAMVRGIASHLGLELEGDEAEMVAEKFSMEANQKKAGELAESLRKDGVDLNDPRNNDHHDPKELLHWNHIKTGAIGGWRDQATPEDVVLLARECGDWLVRNEYDIDPLSAALGVEAQKLRDAEFKIEGLQNQVQGWSERHAEALRTIKDFKSSIFYLPYGLGRFVRRKLVRFGRLKQERQG